MTKHDIVIAISDKTGIERAVVQATIEEIMHSIKDSLSKGENVYLRGFGTFETIVRAEKLGRNISKNTSVVIPAHRIPKFKPCKEFVEQVKNNVK